MTYDGTARHSSDYFLRSSHAHGFFSEEERARRRAVLERINAVEGRSDSGFDHTWNQHDVANEAIQNERYVVKGLLLVEQNTQKPLAIMLKSRRN